jgi:Bardet-Biedl syndrome 9 protein
VARGLEIAQACISTSIWPKVDICFILSNDNGPQIAVLHPRLLSIYSLERGKGKFQEFENYKLQLLYQHNLSRSAFSLTIGPFGRVKNRDFMCVQSIDGTLNLFEQESVSFSRFLPGFLLPGPIEYAKRTDSFVTISSSHQLESYRYWAQSYKNF